MSKKAAARPPRDALKMITTPAKDAVLRLRLMESDLNESALCLQLAAETGDDTLIAETLDELDEAVVANHLLCLEKPPSLPEIDPVIAEVQLALHRTSFEDPNMEATVRQSVAKAVKERSHSALGDAATSFHAARAALKGDTDDDG